MNLDTKLICPKCGRESPFRAFRSPEEILDILKLASRFGSRWQWVLEYLHCFQSDHDKPLRAAKMALLLTEVYEFVEKQGFHFGQKWHTIRSDALFAAIRHVALLNKTGFKNHNYLKKVAIDMNLKMIEKEEADQRARAQEAMKRDPDGARKLKEIIGRLGAGEMGNNSNTTP